MSSIASSLPCKFASLVPVVMPSSELLPTRNKTTVYLFDTDTCTICVILVLKMLAVTSDESLYYVYNCNAMHARKSTVALIFHGQICE